MNHAIETTVSNLCIVLSAMRLEVAKNNPFNTGDMPSVLYKRADNKLFLTVTKLPTIDIADDILSCQVRGMQLINAYEEDKFEYVKNDLHPLFRELPWMWVVRKTFNNIAASLSSVLRQPFAETDNDAYNHCFITREGYFLSFTEISQLDDVSEKDALALITGELLTKHPAVIELCK